MGGRAQKMLSFVGGEQLTDAAGASSEAEPLFRFGDGLSYTTFECATDEKHRARIFTPLFW